MEKNLSWDQIRQQYPHEFVLLEDCENTKISANKTILLRGRVIFHTKDGKEVYQKYRHLGKPPSMSFAHTDWQVFETEEIPWMGLRLSSHDE